MSDTPLIYLNIDVRYTLKRSPSHNKDINILKYKCQIHLKKIT